MNRFVECFYGTRMDKLVKKINEYAERNNLRIISLSASDNLYGAVVLFEGKKPEYRWE